MGLSRLLCCVKPQATIVPGRPSPGKQLSEHPDGSRASGPALAGHKNGRTLLVTAQSGSAQDFHSYLHTAHDGIPPNSPGLPTLQPHISDGHEADPENLSEEHIKEFRASRQAVASFARCCHTHSTMQHSHARLGLVDRADSCPVGDLQRPPTSLLEASSRRRQRAQAPVAKHQPDCREPSESPNGCNHLEAQQTQTIKSFMAAYLATLQGEYEDCKTAMSPLFTDVAVLRAHDGKTYHGKAAILRRMQHGMEIFPLAGHESRQHLVSCAFAFKVRCHNMGSSRHSQQFVTGW